MPVTGIENININTGQTIAVTGTITAGGTGTVSGNVGTVPTTSGGLLVSRIVSAATNNLTTAKASAGQVYGISVQSIAGAAVAYLKLFNGSPTMGTTPCFDQWECPAAGSSQGAGFFMQWPNGIALSTGIYFALTGAISLTDNTAVAANSYNVSVYYF